MRRSTHLVVALLLIGALAACRASHTASLEAIEPKLVYSVGACREDIPADKLASWSGVEIAVQDGAIHIVQRIDYVCCAEIEAQLELDGQTLKLIETNVGQVCRCMCGYDLQADVSGLPGGTYAIEVWGVQYQDAHPLELLGQAEITLP